MPSISNSCQRLDFRGAEAVVTCDGEKVIKHRVKKGYRHPDIDSSLRKSRTSREAKILRKMEGFSPKLLSVNKKDMILELEYIDGKKLSDNLESMDYLKICSEIGRAVSDMHAKDIIHGDLTTSNMIYKDRLYLIDFGLSFISTKAEDKAVDLHLLKNALESRHHTISEECYKAVVAVYEHRDVLQRLKVVEARGRNKQKH